MSVADNDAGAKDGEAGKTDVAYGVFLHADYARIAKAAAGCASYRRKQTKLGDSGVVATTREGTHHTELSSCRSSSSLQRVDPEPTPTQLTEP